MPLTAKAPSRVQETTTTSGLTNPIVLSGAVTKYNSFSSALNDNDLVYYSVINSDGTEWENGIGTFNEPNLLHRTTVRESSNSNNMVNFSAGIKIVAVTPSAVWGDDLITEAQQQALIMTLALS